LDQELNSRPPEFESGILSFRSSYSLNKTGNLRINVTLERVRGVIVTVENNKYVCQVCVCSLSYPACKAHAPYHTVICGLSGCTMFSTLSHKWHGFRKKKFINVKCVSRFFSVNFFETFLILRRNERDIINVF